MTNYKDLLKDFIVENFLFGDGEKLKTETPLFEKGIIDSTGVLELIAFIEENFKIKVSDEELIQSNFSDIIAIDKFIQSKQNHTSDQ
ncbi:MAG: acyl carrier protein [bacterium]|nr:acyl carrier protein [bacterium]